MKCVGNFKLLRYALYGMFSISIAHAPEFFLRKILITPSGSIKKIMFVPQDPATKVLTELINAETISIRGAQYQMTNQYIADALCNAKKRGIAIEIVTDKSTLTSPYQQINKLVQQGILIYPYAKAYLMHNKFWLFEDNFTGKPVIWIGSANTSQAGLESNAETILIWSNDEDAAVFRNEFNRLKETAQEVINKKAQR